MNVKRSVYCLRLDLKTANNPNAEPQMRDLQAAARMLGLQLVILAAGSDRDIDGVFATLRERRIEALLVTADGLFFGLPDKLATLAARHAVPTFYPLSDYVRAGGLISYGANLSESWRQAGIYVGKIVKGTKVADLPVIQPTARSSESRQQHDLAIGEFRWRPIIRAANVE